MSEHRSTSPLHPNSAMVGASNTPASGQQSLRCQWCSVPLAAGIAICPTCGSPGIPDPRMTVAGLTDPIDIQPEPVAAAIPARAVAGGEVELVEWWHNETSDDELTEAPPQSMDFEAVERRRMRSLVAIGGAVLVCAVLGWLIGPTLLEGPFEGLTGTTVENPDDLRSMGTIGGLILGMFVGATAGWVIWSTN